MQRLLFLDCLRGVAALYVVLFHAARVPTFKMDLPYWAHSIVMFGGSGVTLFFVISAFSLSLTMPRHQKSARPLLSFYASRAFRILPLFYFLIPISLFRTWWVWGVWKSNEEIGYNFLVLYNFIPGKQEGIVWASWTIGVEIVFYAVFPYLYFILKDVASKIACLIISLIGVIMIPSVMHHVFADFDVQNFMRFSIIRHFPIFIIGMIAFDVYRHIENVKPIKSVGQVFIAIGLFGIALIVAGKGSNLFFDQYYWQGFFYASILLGCAIAPPKILVNSLFVFFGRISYSIYLIHPIVVFSLGPLYQSLFEAMPGRSLPFLASICLTLAILVPISWLSYRTIERPGELLGRRVVEYFARSLQTNASDHTERV